jgi:hypothetical protein
MAGRRARRGLTIARASGVECSRLLANKGYRSITLWREASVAELCSIDARSGHETTTTRPVAPGAQIKARRQRGLRLRVIASLWSNATAAIGQPSVGHRDLGCFQKFTSTPLHILFNGRSWCVFLRCKGTYSLEQFLDAYCYVLLRRDGISPDLWRVCRAGE